LDTQVWHCIPVFHYFVNTTNAYKSRFLARASFDFLYIGNSTSI
jgi:hypothetical protein